MAEFSILVVPTNRDFIPDPDAAKAAGELLESFYPGREHGADQKDFETPRLVHARDGWDSLTCPSCGKRFGSWVTTTPRPRSTPTARVASSK